MRKIIDTSNYITHGNHEKLIKARRINRWILIQSLRHDKVRKARGAFHKHTNNSYCAVGWAVKLATGLDPATTRPYANGEIMQQLFGITAGDIENINDKTPGFADVIDYIQNTKIKGVWTKPAASMEL